MKILFVAKTYHDGDNYLIKNKEVFNSKNYQKVNEEICNFYSNWLGEFYLLLKKENKLQIEIIFPHLKNLMNEILIDKDRKNYDEHYNYLINEYNADLIIFSGEYEKLYKSMKKNNSKLFLWKSSKIDLIEMKRLKKYFDAIISDNDFILKLAQNLNIENFYLEPSIPQRIISNFSFKNRINEIFFSGSLGFDFNSRKEILKYLIKNNINLELRCRDIKEKNKFKEFILNKFNNIKFINSKRSILKKISKEPLFHFELINYMKKFKFILNCHSDFDVNKTINYRVYESLGCGSLLFTDENNALERNNFIDEFHLIVYKNKQDLHDKIKYFTNNLSEAESIAKQGYELVKSQHTSEKRLIQFKKIININ